MMDNKRRVEFVTPGDKLGVVEEFSPGLGTYEVNGVIYAKTVGLAIKDLINKKIYIKTSIRKPVFPSEGDEVLGVVTGVQDKIAVINVFLIKNTILSNSFTGFLHISASSHKFEKTMSDICKATDIIKARVSKVKNGLLQLTTVGEDLGVILAYCSLCGNELNLKSRKGVLECKNCGNIEYRKIAKTYGFKITGGEKIEYYNS
ncbi:MAG: exosome complex RNA-binding protein Csl4 [Candidatus Bathyarchaeia archaeon]|nr:exosome complex RNA-binding protein Csl4 [Candidatus Bathyarchaeota archaeon]